jgi:D-serine deaminase-like pyridoxal phosphate-dependent protein
VHIGELTTPCLLLERAKLERNLARMRARARRLGVPLRPHLKTAKCIEIARLALEGEPGGITVSTLGEAAWFLDHGIRDIVYAVGIAPGKLDAAAGLLRRGARLALILDDPFTAQAVGERGAALGVRFPVLIEIDCDGARAGVAPGAPELLAIARLLHASEGAALGGVLTHAGAAYHCGSIAALRAMAEQERRCAVQAAAALRAAGLPAPVVSVGSTPTMTFADRLDGVTEARPGVYMFQDLVLAGLAVCAIEDIALSVLASVIGHQARSGALIVDAGWMALSRDQGTAEQSVNQGYGLVCDLSGRPLRDLIVRATNQEHGLVGRRDGAPLHVGRYPVGTRLRILPVHACATAAAHAAYEVVEEGGVTGRWLRCGGWE